MLLALGACISTPTPGYNPPNAHKNKQVKKHPQKKLAKSSVKKNRSNKAVIRYVRAKDTLYSIGNMFDVDYKLIAKRNNIPYPYSVYIGQRLYIDRQAPKKNNWSSKKNKPRAKVKKAVPRAKKAPPKKSYKKVVKSSPKNRSSGSKSKLIWPVIAPVTSKFGRRGSRMHDGIDIGAKEGAPVRAAASGIVVYSDSRLSGYGKLIIIRHGKGLFTAYGHNQRNLVRKGKKVKRGDIIARVGHTGRSTGPHLHFEVRQGSTPVNPIAYLPRR